MPGTTPLAPDPTPKVIGYVPTVLRPHIKGVEGGLGAASDARVVAPDELKVHVFPLRHDVPPTEGVVYEANEGVRGVGGWVRTSQQVRASPPDRTNDRRLVLTPGVTDDELGADIPTDSYDEVVHTPFESPTPAL